MTQPAKEVMCKTEKLTVKWSKEKSLETKIKTQAGSMRFDEETRLT